LPLEPIAPRYAASGTLDKPEAWNKYGQFGLFHSNFRASFADITGRNIEMAPLNVDFVSASRVPFVNLNGLSYRVWRLRKGQVEKLEPGALSPLAQIRSDPKLPKVANLRDGERQVVFTASFQFPSPKQSLWDAYHIQMLPGPGNLNVPDWVAEWSGSDDAAIEHGRKTLHLELFVEAMLREITERLVFLDSVILLGKG
jgi:hypothetical protein